MNPSVDTEKKPRGRPRLQIDEKHLARLCHIQCTYKEMAKEFDCDMDTLRDNYSELVEKEREKGKAELRAYQWYLMKHHKSIEMAKWLGKEYLGQGKSDITTIDISPLEDMTNSLKMIQQLTPNPQSESPSSLEEDSLEMSNLNSNIEL